MSGALFRPLPLSVTTSSGFTGPERLVTPEPKEVAVAVGGAGQIGFDLGAATMIDTVFVGYTSDAGATPLSLTYGVDNAFSTSAGPATASLPTMIPDERRHYFWALPAAVNARYIGLSGDFPAGFEIGVVGIGKRWWPALGYDLGSGRPVIDTGTASRRRDGGFGIDEGVVAGGWQWTFGAMSPAEVNEFYGIARNRGTGRTIFVAEDITAPLSEALHWSLLQRIEPYERTDIGETKWSLRIEDWA